MSFYSVVSARENPKNTKVLRRKEEHAKNTENPKVLIRETTKTKTRKHGKHENIMKKTRKYDGEDAQTRRRKLDNYRL